jgi:uncharacterized protein
MFPFEPLLRALVRTKEGHPMNAGNAATLDPSATILPIEVHLFKYNSEYYAFDVRSFAILKLDSQGAAVLSRMQDVPFDALIERLSEEMPAPVARAYAQKFLELVRDGVLSIQPVDRPGRPYFNRLVIMLAGGCNMGCTYCFEKDVPIYQEPNFLTRERASEIVDWFCKYQEGEWAHVQLYGGEPLLNWPILQHVVERLEAWASRYGKHLTKYLITNGTLLTSERIAYLKEHGVEIQVSVDGDTKTHDLFRIFKSGKPTMERIKPNIQELIKQGANFNLRAVMTRRNPDPNSVVEGLRSHGAEDVSFEVVATDYEAARFTDQDWDEFNGKYETYVDSDFASWRELPHEMQSTILHIAQHQRIFYGCGAGVSEVTVGPDGSIYECQRIYRKPYSHVSEGKSPTELDSKFLTMVDDRPVCKDCWARYLCGGGCMQQSHVGHGSDEPLPQYCTMKRHLVEASIVHIDRIRSMRKGSAGFPEVIWSGQ